MKNYSLITVGYFAIIFVICNSIPNQRRRLCYSLIKENCLSNVNYRSTVPILYIKPLIEKLNTDVHSKFCLSAKSNTMCRLLCKQFFIYIFVLQEEIPKTSRNYKCTIGVKTYLSQVNCIYLRHHCMQEGGNGNCNLK